MLLKNADKNYDVEIKNTKNIIKIILIHTTLSDFS
jgi:hypothetical protein